MATKTTHREALRYYALSATGTNDWSVEAEGEPGEAKAAVEERAMRAICGSQWDQPKDIYVDTLVKNLLVISKSQAHRRFPTAMWAWDHRFGF